MFVVTNLPEIREKLNLRKSTICEEMGVAVSTVNKWETGKRMQDGTMAKLKEYIATKNAQNGFFGDNAIQPVFVSLAYGQEYVPEEKEPVSDEQIEKATEEGEHLALTTVQKLAKYVSDDDDNPIIERFFGKDWRLSEIIVNTDMLTMRQFVREYELGKDIKPEDVVDMTVDGKRLLFAVLKNDNGILMLYRNGEVYPGIHATDVRKSASRKWAITTVKE